jgi:hypothetical protein
MSPSTASERLSAARLGAIAKAWPDDEAGLRAIFDAGRELGLSLGQTWDAQALAQWLSTAGLPCLSGDWRLRADGAWELRRPPCAGADCERWREACDGLVMGLGDSLRYARHFKGEAGECLDLLYEDQDLRWARLPEALVTALDPLQASLQRHQAGLELQGYAEGTVYYRLHDTHALRAHRRGFLLGSVSDFAARQLPGLRLCETSPRAIWEGD